MDRNIDINSPGRMKLVRGESQMIRKLNKKLRICYVAIGILGLAVVVLSLLLIREKMEDRKDPGFSQAPVVTQAPERSGEETTEEPEGETSKDEDAQESAKVKTKKQNNGSKNSGKAKKTPAPSRTPTPEPEENVQTPSAEEEHAQISTEEEALVVIGDEEEDAGDWSDGWNENGGSIAPNYDMSGGGL